MFDIRKIQEEVIYDAVEKASNKEKASEIVYGLDGVAKGEKNPAWVKSTMKRLENEFPGEKVKNIRINCKCGYNMDEKLKLVKELMSLSSNIEELGNLEKSSDAGLFYKV